MKLTRPFSSRTQFSRTASTINSGGVGMGSGLGSGSGTNTGSRPSSFGEKRSQDSNDRYNKAIEERQKMARAQYAVDGDDSLKDVYEMKSNLLDRKIRRMEDEMKDNGSI